METITLTNSRFLSILQLASPSLPVGAYSYSEGLEVLVENRTIHDRVGLKNWLDSELRYGSIRIDGAVMIRAIQSTNLADLEGLKKWNYWLSAFRDTQELRAASWQMGRSLLQLLGKLSPPITSISNTVGYPCNYAIAFGIGCGHWQIDARVGLLAYLHSWASNLITAGIKLIPLGQTSGQELLWELQGLLDITVEEILSLEDDHLSCCSWGLSLASMQHETQYTRLFRS
ncbi:urease accessory protein UreF [Cylindrospermopsis raciborskii CHAB3438]|jgi:urease accessory protein|uniref:urease accessory protein UreF n=1 Tax=Cylindrospermopsis raciborskii TaxID=77022 RepID=UPI000E1E57C6|nr:urease accessory protein UreF [Cylindrospermopsis raciborskii]MCH4904404.1 urease accessory protein UreF [Cylindrospermopsis raciborskii CHAB3438]MEB3144573.1 urease accessory protein UreF [Cylindrospermopsis raciborskii]TPX29747.1 urease accessory protein UreF [Cylindrospermopsis raciborskii GIHE 2018]UJL32914.1 urease accessory protein UreF [Cylindrospermopsis raciborskii Cr2010]UJS05392.1 urease accessory protein UreF [Cylindrospermopsis raciborskii KLL07]